MNAELLKFENKSQRGFLVPVFQPGLWTKSLTGINHRGFAEAACIYSRWELALQPCRASGLSICSSWGVHGQGGSAAKLRFYPGGKSCSLLLPKPLVGNWLGWSGENLSLLPLPISPTALALQVCRDTFWALEITIAQEDWRVSFRVWLRPQQDLIPITPGLDWAPTPLGKHPINTLSPCALSFNIKSSCVLSFGIEKKKKPQNKPHPVGETDQWRLKEVKVSLFPQGSPNPIRTTAAQTFQTPWLKWL